MSTHTHSSMHHVEWVELSCVVGFDVDSGVELAELGRGAYLTGPLGLLSDLCYCLDHANCFKTLRRN